MDNNYFNSEYNNTGSYQEPNIEPPKKEIKNVKKGNGFGKKLLFSAYLGICFGLLTGLGFYAVWEATGLEVRGQDGSTTQSTIGTINNMNQDTSLSGINITDTSELIVVTSDVSDVVEEVMPAMV